MKERYHFEDLDVDGMIMLRWILRKWGGNVRTGVVWFGIGARPDERLDSIKRGEIVHKLKNC